MPYPIFWSRPRRSQMLSSSRFKSGNALQNKKRITMNMPLQIRQNCPWNDLRVSRMTSPLNRRHCAESLERRTSKLRRVNRSLLVSRKLSPPTNLTALSSMKRQHPPVIERHSRAEQLKLQQPASQRTLIHPCPQKTWKQLWRTQKKFNDQIYI